MFKLKKRKKDNKGFTLVELVIVIAILAILVGLLAPQYGKYVEKSRKSADANNLEEMAKAFQVATAEMESGLAQGSYTIAITKTGTRYVFADASKSSLETYMKSTLGDSWGASGTTSATGTKLKSSSWTDNGEAVAEISVTFKVTATGSITTTYTPDDELKNFMSAS